MRYVEQNLMPGEHVSYQARLHSIIYAGPAALAFLGLIFSVFSIGNRYSQVAIGFAVLLFAVAGVYFLSRWVTARTSEFAVTNKRVIIKVGLIRRHTLELLLTKVESIGVDQGILGRVLGYGSIVVIGTGGTKEPFKNIAEPLEFRKQVQARALT